LAERDVVRSGDSVWLYDSSQSAATHLVFTGGAKKKDASREASAAPEVTPTQLATQLIAQLQPTTGFDVSSSDRVAGRATYRLTLTPKAADSLVADATVAVDAHTGVPLEVSVYAKGQSSPAVQVKFSSIRYGSPAADVFRFSPPKGAKVETQQITPQDLAGARGDAPKLSGAQKPTVIGTGWDAIAELPAGSLDLSQLTQQAAQSGADASAMLNLLQQVDGGRGIQTSLVSVLITDDGRVLAGAVPLTALENAAK
ncbi:MAG: DUF2092 domain-containing protein, partial [Microbacteriaceae bacterium]|nr:DUF2092 domain-containing protein [Microbacteriaceae bacterium]